MTNAEMIQQQLIQQFPATEGKFRIQRERRIWVEVPLESFINFFKYAVKELKFIEFCTMTGLDDRETLSFIYHLAQQSGTMLNIKITVAKSSPVIPTVTQYFPAATLAEREVEDLLGAKVEGLLPGRRYPLPDDWPLDSYPLLKDWKPEAATTVKTEAVNNG